MGNPPWGQDVRTAKLTNETVYEIRRRWDAGERDFHEDYGIAQITLRKIGGRHSWKRLPEEHV